MKETDRNYDLAVKIIADALRIVDAHCEDEEALSVEEPNKYTEHQHNADGWREIRRQIVFAAENHDAYAICKRRKNFTEDGLMKWASAYLW